MNRGVYGWQRLRIGRKLTSYDDNRRVRGGLDGKRGFVRVEGGRGGPRGL